MLTAIGLTDAGNAREKLRVGYVQLEAFIADVEFEIVKELLDRLEKADGSVPHGSSAGALRRMAARPEGAGTPANAILMRIAEQMLARQHELWGRP